MHAMLETAHQQVIQQYAAENGDLHTRTLVLAQIQTVEYFKQVLSDDLIGTLSDIREAHKQDSITADGEFAAKSVRPAGGNRIALNSFTARTSERNNFLG